MQVKQIMTASALALVLGGVPALAETRSGDAGPAWRPALLTADFGAIDADGDGRISLEEWTGFLAGQREAMRAQMIEARVEALFEAGDADGDGLLSPEELATAMAALHDERMQARAARREARGEARGEMRGEMRPRAGRERGGRHGRMEGRMGRMGRMGNPEERAERMFQRIDSDGDGYIIPEELSAAQERWAERIEQRAERRGRGNRAD